MLDVSPTVDLMGHLRDALAHLYDRAYLRKHPLVQLVLGTDVPNPADRIREALLDCIEQLRPAEPCPPTSPAWRQYRYMVLRYVEGLKPETVARELQVSVRQSRREHDQALANVASYLMERRPRLSSDEKASTANLPLEEQLVTSTAEQTVARPTVADGELIRIGALRPEEPTDVDRAISDAVSTVSGLASIRGARFETEVSSSLPPVWVHRLVLSQVLIDLLSVAIETCEGPSIRIDAISSDRAVTVGIVVTGRAIVSISSTGAADPRLVTSKTLVELQGGKLSTRIAGPGALEVTLTLPLLRARTLLVVDDNPDVAYLFSRFLRDQSFRVLQASTGAMAFELARMSHPDAIVLDVFIPSQSGWDILRQLNVDPVTMSIPVILCSVLPERSLALSLGVVEFLNKPVTKSALLDALARCVAS